MVEELNRSLREKMEEIEQLNHEKNLLNKEHMLLKAHFQLDFPLLELTKIWMYGHRLSKDVHFSSRRLINPHV